MKHKAKNIISSSKNCYINTTLMVTTNNLYKQLKIGDSTFSWTTCSPHLFRTLYAPPPAFFLAHLNEVIKIER
jgi:hypothetical protein